MAKLVFRVQSDWEEVVRLRSEIAKLKQELKNMDGTQSPAAFKALNTQLAASNQKLDELVTNAAKAGATMENDFKKGIYDGEKAVNSLSEEIIKQKNIIRETQNDVSMLTEQYKKLGKYDPKRQSLSDELNRAKAALGEQKYALGELQSQQALVRLSTKALKDEYALFKDESKAVITVNEGVGVSFKKTLAAIGGIAMLKQVASNVVSTAGMFQKYESVLTNALNGSSEKAKAYLSDINSFAAKTNFQLDELTDDFIKFVNRGVTPSMDAMKKMGDFTNTVAKPFDQLTEAILDINNPERWKEFGVRVQTEGNKVKLSFRDMTVECDRTVESVMKAVEQFGSMKGVEGSTEAIAKTIEGQMSNLEDTITTALAEIGLANQDLISGSISAVDTIVKNYDIIGKSVLALIEIYGIYRAGLLINTIVEQGSVKSIWAKITATKAATIAQAAYNKVLIMNPYVAVGMAVVSLGVAVYTLADNTTYAEKTARSAAESMEKMKNASDSLKNKINELLSVIRDETSTQYKKADAYLKLQGILPEVFKNMDIEKIKLMDKLSLLEKINEASDRREIVGAKTNVVLAQKEVDKINALIAADSKRGTYSGQYEIQLSDAKSKLEAAKKVVADIKKIQIEANKQKEKEDKKVVVKNKEYWTNQKKEAETALNSIASSQKKLLDAGKFEGINASVIKSYKDNVKKLKDAEKELKTYDSSSKQESAAKKQKKEQQKTSEGLLSLRRQNQQAEIDLMKEGTEKKLKQIDLDYQKELDAIKKQEKELSEKQKGKLTSEQSIEISDRYTNAENKRDKAMADITKEQLKAEQQALNDYLKEYGTFQQQKLAIAQEYAEKIKKAQEENGVNSAQVKLLEKQRDVAIQNKETEAIKANIDWVTVFGEFGGMFNDMVKPALEEAKKYVRTDKFKNSDQASQKALIDAINQMEKSLSKAGGLNFKKLGQDIKTYQMAEQDRLIAIEDEKTAQDKLIKAQEDYEKALKNGTEEEKRAAQHALDMAQQNADTASANVQAQTDIANESQQNLTNTATNLRANMNNVVEGFSKLASGGISSAYQGLLQAGSAMKGAIGEVTKNLKDVPIIGWIVAIIDVFKDGLSDVIGGLLDAVFNAVSGIIDDVLSGDLFVTIGESLVKGVSKIFDAITWGGFSSWTNSGDSDPRLEEDIELLTTSNQDLKNAIDNLAEKMDNASILDSTEIYNQQKANLEQQMYNTQEMMRRSAEAYSNGFIGIGGSHSSNKKINDTMSSADWERISKIVGTTINSAGDFWNLTSKQMAMVSSEATDLYSKIKNAADDGYKDAAQYMDSYIGYYKELEELQNRYYEKLTSTSFDSIKDSFRSSLLEMKDNAEAFTKDFEEMMQNALLEIMMTNIYDKQLQEWYDNFAKRVESDGKLTDAEIDASRKEYMAIVDRAKAEWEKYQEMIGDTGNTSSQEASKKGLATASQDSIDELNGRFTALQIAGEEIKNQSVTQSQSLNILTMKADTLISINTETRNIADDTRDLIASSYLELVQISENTGAIIKPIQQMQKDISEVKNNTKGLSTK